MSNSAELANVYIASTLLVSYMVAFFLNTIAWAYGETKGVRALTFELLLTSLALFSAIYFLSANQKSESVSGYVRSYTLFAVPLFLLALWHLSRAFRTDTKLRKDREE